MPDISKRVQKAEKYLQKGKAEEALQEYLLAFREDPANDSLVEIIAELYLRQNQTKQALECYGYLFDKRVEQNDGPAAVLMFRKMARLGVQDPDRLMICSRFQEKQKTVEAREGYRACVRAFLERGDKEKALEALRGLSALEENNADLHVQVAELAEELGKTAQAADSYLRAGVLLRSPDSLDGSPERALKMLEKAYELAPSDVRIATLLATTNLEQGNAQRAAELLENVPVNAVPDRNRLLAQAYLAAGNLTRAEELLWTIASSYPEAYTHLLLILDRHLEAKNLPAAMSLLPGLKQAMISARREKEFMAWVDTLRGRQPGGVELLEFKATLYKELNQDSLYGETIQQLFELAMKAGQYAKAANALDILADLNPYDGANKDRLERLNGNLDEERFRALSAHVHRTAGPASVPQETEAAGSLDEMILQAEMLLQFSSREQATEYLRQVARQFPGEENRNEKLRALFVEAGLAAPAPAAPAPAAAAAPVAAAAPQEPVVDIRRVSEITRSIHRQGSVKAVLSAAVNEIGKLCEASRCVAGLCTPGKPPSAAMEYCASGTKPSDVVSIVKLVTTLVQATANGRPLAFEAAAAPPELARIAPVFQSLEIKSLLAVPLMDVDECKGVVVLEQCDRSRDWRPAEVEVLRNIVDQMVLATSQVKLRTLVKAVADERSGLLQRSSYLDCLMKECGRAQEENGNVCVALLRFGSGPRTMSEVGEDRFRRFMQEAADALISQLRQNDIGLHYDPTTLAVVFRDMKGSDAGAVVEKIRKLTGVIRVSGQQGIPLTAGIAEALGASADPEDAVTELINRVEEAVEAGRKNPGTTLILPPPQIVAASHL